MDNAVGSLTQFQKSLIIGTILGDGYLRILPRSKNALLEINHSYNQKEYVDWKYRLLKDVSASAPKIRKGNGNRIAYRFYTRQLEGLSKLYRMFYRNGKKIIPDELNLDVVSLAVWYMDDGSRCRSSDVYLNSQQFDVSDQKRLIAVLRKMNLETSLNRDKNYFRLRFKKSSLSRLRELLADAVIPSMKYKIEL